MSANIHSPARRVLILAALLTVTGCTAPSPQSPIVVSMSAASEVELPAAGEVKFPVVVRLENRGAHAVELFAGTPCAVFDWVVMAGERVVQHEPNWLCAQVVASEVLSAGRAVRAANEIVLDAERYVAGRYRLRYSFWNHAGHFDFTVTRGDGN